MNYMDMKENFKRFEIYFNNWLSKTYTVIRLIPNIDVIIDNQMNKTIMNEDMIGRYKIFHSRISIGVSIGWLFGDMYMQVNFKTNKPLED